MSEVERVRAARQAMELSIRGAAVKAVAEFAAATGLTPEAVHVQMVSVHPLGVSPFHVVGSVDARVVL